MPPYVFRQLFGSLSRGNKTLAGSTSGRRRTGKQLEKSSNLHCGASIRCRLLLFFEFFGNRGVTEGPDCTDCYVGSELK